MTVLIGLYFSINAVPEMFLKCITPEVFNCGHFYNHECMLQINHIFDKSDQHLVMVRSFLMTSIQHVYNINTSRTKWKHCHVYRVNRGCPRGHMLVTHCSKYALLRNLPGESKRADGPRCIAAGISYYSYT